MLPTRLYATVVAVAACAFGLRAQAPARKALPAAFQHQLTASRLRFVTPAGTVPVALKRNGQMDCDYAYRFTSRAVEVRYAIRPLGPLLAEFRRTKGQPNADLSDPNELYPTQAAVVLANISGGQMPALREFPARGARFEFGSDWAAIAQVSPSRQFAPGFRYCLVLALHRRDVADVYCVYLFQKQADIDWLVGQPTPAAAPVHALRFE